jgi:hypothetical protein
MTDYADTDASGLPAICYGTHPTDDTLIIIRRNTSGYWDAEGYSMGAFDTWSGVADFLNHRRGITRAQRAAMEAGSLFGFDCAAADPSRYDDAGRFRQIGRSAGQGAA